MNRKITVSNIQRFSLHDGPGIRTTVFLKGCSLHCPWCANPENINPSIEPYTDGEKTCFYGKEISLKEIFDECVKDKVFYGNDGGVTFSGGEPLLNIHNYKPLLYNLKKENISLCVETALFVNKQNVELSAQYIDFYCVDIKILDAQKCKKILGNDIELYKSNVRYLLDYGKKIQFRVPLIAPFTTDLKNIESITNFCVENGIKELELIKGHNLAVTKYKSLRKPMYVIPDISNIELTKLQTVFFDNGIKTELCMI